MSDTQAGNVLIAGNKLIAEFMGLKYNHGKFCNTGSYIDDNGDKHITEFAMKEVQYHTSFDWLMPVVEKIESLWINGAQSRCKIERTYVEIVHEVGYQNVDFAFNSNKKKDNQLGGAEYPNKNTKIENLYEVVIAFINWYNSTQPKTNTHVKE